MKKIMKSRIFIFILTAIMFTSIGVYAATTYKASEVVYNSSDGTSMSVNDALNELYQSSKTGGYVGLMWSKSAISPASKNIAVVYFNQNYGTNTSTSITLTKNGTYRIITIPIHNPKEITYTTHVKTYLNGSMIGSDNTAIANFVTESFSNKTFTVSDSSITITANYSSDYPTTNDGIHGGFVIIIKE